MMTGILTGSKLWTAYLFAIFLCVICFAIYDIHTKRVPNKALAILFPFAVLSPILQIYFQLIPGISSSIICPVIIQTFLGSLFGFLIPLTGALASDSGCGIGGGDIKFCGIIGLIYGADGIVLILLTAASLAMPVSLFFRRFLGKQPLAIPFLPFIACGCYVATLVKIF